VRIEHELAVRKFFVLNPPPAGGFGGQKQNKVKIVRIKQTEVPDIIYEYKHYI